MSEIIARCLTRETLVSALSYNPEAGEFRWAKRSGNRKFGEIAGGLTDKGYLRIKLFRETYFAHRLAWFYMTDETPIVPIDHIDGNRTNNRFINLRLATPSQNGANRKVLCKNKSGFKGVRWHPGDKGWRAEITCQHRSYFLGLFASPEDAHCAYVEAAKRLFGEFARAA